MANKGDAEIAQIVAREGCQQSAIHHVIVKRWGVLLQT